MIDGANNRVGIGTNTPSTKLDVKENTENTYGIIAARGNNRGGALELYNGSTITAAIYSLTTNDLLFYNGNYVERMRINSSGSVGIGITNPSVTLDVSGSISSTNTFRISKSPSDTIQQGPSIYLVGGTGSSYTQLQQGVGRFIIFGFNGSSWDEKLTINNTSGNVGIGLTNPSTKLHVVNNEDTNWSATIANTVTNGHTVYVGYNNSTTTYGVYVTGGSSSGFGLAVQDKFYVNNNGRVGIGTSEPADIIDVRKNQNATTNFYFRNTDTTNASSRAYLNVVAGNTTMSMLALHGGDTYLAGTSGRNMYFQQNPGGTVNMFISSSGNVGIGITNPSSKLEVNGTTTIYSTLNVNAAGAYSTNGNALNIESNSWAIVDANVKRQMQRVIGYVGDYEQHVILLHPIYDGTLVSFCKAYGSIHASRGATYAGRISDTYEIDTSTGYNSYNGTLKSNTIQGRLYTCTYGGLKYLALIPGYRTSAVTYHFDGYTANNIGGETLKLVTYRMSNSGTVVNSEINNSLAAYTEDDTFINGLVYPRQGIRFASGATTLNYYEEGTFTPTNVGTNMGGVTTIFGRYVRIGNQVTVNCKWTVSPNGTGQKYLVFNLPFSFANDSNVSYTGAVSNYNNGLSAYSSNVGTSVRNSSGSTTQQYVEAVFTTNAETTLHFSMTYFTF